jgi:hypothetical protein
MTATDTPGKPAGDPGGPVKSHPYLGIDDIDDVWASSPLFDRAKPPAHWLMCAEVGGRLLMVPLAPARSGDPGRCPSNLADRAGRPDQCRTEMYICLPSQCPARRESACTFSPA